jgi:hypothetical protein
MRSILRLVVLLSLAAFCTHASAFWFLLGRGMVARGGAHSIASADMSWLGREITKSAIEQAMRNASPTQQSLNQSQCLVLEFDGASNHIANFCNYSVSIARIIVSDAYGAPNLSQCTGCSVQPGQIVTLRFSSNSVVGPIVVIEQLNSEPPLATAAPVSTQERFEDLIVKVIRSSYNNQSASVLLEIRNPSPLSAGLVVATRSIWSTAVASVFNQCGGKYEQWNSPYDGFSGISKSAQSGTVSISVCEAVG